MAYALIRSQDDRLLVSGELNFATVVDLWEASLPLLALREQFIFDFSQVSACNSAALALILEWRKYAKGLGKVIEFQSLPEQLVLLAGVVGLKI